MRTDVGCKLYRVIYLLGIATFALAGSSTGTLTVSRAKPLPTPSKDMIEHMRRTGDFPTVDYDEALPTNSEDRERRIKINRRYDGAHGVSSQPPRPEITGSYSIPEGVVAPPVLPVAESDLVIVGRVSGVHAHLSNDKKGIYSEVDIDVTEMLKADAKVTVRSGQKIDFDVPGGVVRYPNGQTWRFHVEGIGIPDVGQSVLLFLKFDDKDPNYEMLRGYELFDTSFVTLNGSSLDLEGWSSTDLLETVRERVTSSKPEKTP